MSSLPESVPAPEVQTLSVAEFIKAFPPMYYAGTWQDILAATETEPNLEDEYDTHFLASGTSGMDFDDLVCSVEDHGILHPVDVIDGKVEDGHHRVVAAMYAAKSVRFRVW